MYNFIELQKASTGKLTFVSKNRKELHKNVRRFIADSVKAYAESGSHKLDAKVGLRVALEFSRQYAPHVRSALSKVSGAVSWSYDKSGNTSYKKCDIARKPEKVADVLAVLNASLDTIDDLNAKPERTDAEKLANSGKSFTTSLVNVDGDKLGAALSAIDALESDELHNLYSNLNTLMTKVEAMVTLSGVAAAG